MPRKIYKYALSVSDATSVDMPRGARLIKVAEHAKQLCVWAEVDPAANLTVARVFRIYGTGHDMDPASLNQVHLDSVVMSNGLVWHVYEIT